MSADDARLDQLGARLYAHPDDVDARLRLALMLSWRGDRAGARVHATRVVTQTPEYWEAHMLLARLDAWDGAYASARARLGRIPEDAPGEPGRLRMLADMAIWGGEPLKARPYLQELLTYDKSAGIHYRLAVIEQQELNHFSAWRAARRALKVEPGHGAALRLRDSTRLISTDLLYEVEVSPDLESGQTIGHGTVVSATWLPRARWSATLTDEYRYRYGTHNNRVTLSGDWRATKDITVGASLGVGAPAEVVSKFTAGARITLPFAGIFDAGAGYTFDMPPWGGHLHRTRLDLGVAFPKGFSADVTYTLGLLARCGNADDLHGTGFAGHWEHGPLTMSLHYGYGLELDRPPVPVKSLFTEEGCLIKDRPYASHTDPVELSTHNMGVDFKYKLNERVTLRGGFDTVVRTNETQVHTSRVAIRTWF